MIYTFLNDARSAKYVTDKFEVEWKKETGKIALGKKPSLIKALYRVLWAKFFLTVVVRFVCDVLIVISPLILKMGVVMSYSLYKYYARETGLLSRTILITTIYRKALVLSGKARSLFTNGKIINLMSTDTTRIDVACTYFHIIWAAPMQICIILGKIMSLLTRTRTKAANVTDERVKLTQEILLGIRAIKYYVWEDSFADALNKLRNKEISLIRFLLVIRAAIAGVSLAFPIFASILSFITFSLTGGSLDVGIVFSSLALFNLLRIPLIFFPISIGSATDAYVSINRINDFLQADELSVLPEFTPDEQYAIKVTDGEFIWVSAPPEIIDNSKEEMKKEKMSQKHKRIDNNENNTSLIIANEKSPDAFTPADLTENFVSSQAPQDFNFLTLVFQYLMENWLPLRVLFGGNVVYCPQTAWIQNATLKDNITFGLPFDEKKYLQVIKDCCLEPDLKVLPAGDLTEIGEKGINLSGGQKQRVNIARAVYYNADIVLLDDPLSAVDAHVGRYIFTNCIQGALAKKTRLLVTHHLHYLPQVDYVIYMEDGKIVEQGTYEKLMKDGKTFSKLIAEYGADNDGEIKNDEESRLDEKENKNDQLFALPKGLMSTEEQCRGAVSNGIYLAYFRNAGGLLSILIIIFLLIMMQGANLGNNLWLSFWSSNTFDFPVKLYMDVYCAWGVAQGIFGVLCGVAFSYSGIKAAKKLHNTAIKRVLRAPTTALFYRASNRELKRLDSVLRSSLYTQFSETLTGLPIIRAYREQKRFLRFNVAPSITGLVLSYALQTWINLSWCIEQTAEVETNMNSVERLVHYSDNLEVEAENIIPDNRPPIGWPARGEIHIKNLEVKYGPDSPLVLKGISIDIMAAEKIGIVGRTGCGKSTLATSFLRFIEATSGSIVIDDVDISTIGLKDLRSNITIIPQDPVLFDGALSPISEKEEAEDILYISDQKNTEQELIMLDSPVKENGSNFSQGQQQCWKSYVLMFS
ncbi:P-loop containing nucleoside triphosphate hydrolase protein [Gigaspora rosea]|uniref:P-loop containing nucleoside triphosphate hydrolase protein n=1 Tax=Gigaspora rosea TaxID=44941 RepID=A0A397V912_9GLOM|nr:P-loop containing nucleoside triphosphate hydrolase protein [Gigaspora rosea]